MNTADLVSQALGGSQDAFAELVRRYRDAASAVAYTYFGSFDDVQDAVQEAFVHSYVHLAQLKDPAKYGPWLRRVTANASLTRLRKRKLEAVSLDETQELASSAEDPQKTAARLAVRDALGRLSEDLRLTVTLTYINGYSHSEVAHFLDVPLETVRSRLKHAKRKLREEMIGMVEEVLHDDKPGEELLKRIWDSMRSAGTAMFTRKHEEALRLCNDALAAVRHLGSSRTPEQIKELALKAIDEGAFGDAEQWAEQRAMMEATNADIIKRGLEAESLIHKGDALLRLGRVDEAKAMFREALKLTEGFEAHPWVPGIGRIAQIAHWNGQHELAKEYLPQALETARKSGETYKEAENLWALADECMDDRRVKEARPMYERAYEIFRTSAPPAGLATVHAQRTALMHAVLTLIDEVGEERFPELVHLGAFWLEVRKTDMTVETTDMGEGRKRRFRSSGPPGIGLYWHICALYKFLDTTVSPGGSWSGYNRFGEAFKTTITVMSNGEQVDVPAGSFDNCLLLEMVTVEDPLPKKTSEDQNVRLRSRLAGTRRIWFAPGVGLVRLLWQSDASEVTIHLTDYTVGQPSSEYFPLAIGNCWTYGLANMPEDYVAKEVYRVVANEGDLWYLENYEYAWGGHAS